MQNENKLERKKKQADLSAIVYGKIPPQATDLEECVLGAMMIDKYAIISTIDLLRPEMFYDDRHVRVFTAIRRLFESNRAIDLLTVTEELRKMGELEESGGPYYVTSLTNRVGSSAHIEDHAKIVIQKYLAREMIKFSTQTCHDAYEDTTDIFELIQAVEKSIFDLTTSRGKNARRLSSIILENIKRIDRVRQHPEELSGIPSGIIELDRVTGGWQKTDLIIIAARPSMGKSALFITVVYNAGISFGKPIAVFSLEMSEEQVSNRVLSMEAEVEQQDIKRGKLNDAEMDLVIQAADRIGDPNIFIDDTPALGIFDLKAKARRMKMQYGIELIVVDYLQLMTVAGRKSQNREGDVSEISRGLKAIAKELNVPVIALAQLNRNVEQRGGSKRPMLSDLRESGAIEQDADMVMFIHRPEYYGIEVDESGNSTRGVAELIIAKHRNGALENVKTQYISKYTVFKDWEDYSVPQRVIKNFYEKESSPTPFD